MEREREREKREREREREQSTWRAPAGGRPGHGKRPRPDFNRGPADLQSAVLAAGLRSHVLLKRTIFGLRPTVSSLASRPRVGGGTTFRWAHCPSPASRISPRLHGATGGIKSRTLDAHSAAHAVDGSRAICPICRERRHGVRWRPLARLPSRAPHSAVTHSRRRRDAIGSDGDCAPPPHLWQKRRRAARWELISLGDIPRTHGTPRPVLRCSAFRASHLHPTKAPQPCKRSRNAPTDTGSSLGCLQSAAAAHLDGIGPDRINNAELATCSQRARPMQYGSLRGSPVICPDP